jgi:hypothetical protein
MPKQHPLKIDTTFIETKPAGLAAKYLNSGEIHSRAGVEIAIACVFAPLGAAIDGASRDRVEQLIAASRTQIETYFALALNRCAFDKSESQTTAQISLSTEANGLEIDFAENIDIDNEEF